RSELAAVRAERERTGESLAALTSEYQRLEGELAAEQERRRDLGESLSSQREGLEEATEALAEARETREAVRSELEAVRSRAGETAELEARLAAADAEIERRADTLQAVRQRVLDLENELDSLNRRSEELAAELELKEAEVNRLNAERDAAREQVASLQQEIEKVVEIKDAEVRQIRESVTMIRMDSDIVFATGSTRLRDEGRAVLDSVADYARQTPERVISLEGHTDSVPIALDNRDRFPSNWELSAARAASAARFLAGRGIDPARMRIVGFGEYQPMGDNDSEEGRRANRRLEIVLAP